ncbi:MAG: NAD-dependent deacetylase, partial [Deltaproteobacteria bacterium]|nr:NAD-dependent deacetylase [Deltaproteobacteria bacterium]
MRIEEFAARVKQSSAVVFFTGAGISTESGVPDFRSPGGVWTKYQPVLFQDFLASESARVQHWQLKKATYELFKTVKPNIGHQAICAFEQRGQLLGLITQNIDGLHKIAGTNDARLVELHGT